MCINVVVFIKVLCVYGKVNFFKKFLLVAIRLHLRVSTIEHCGITLDGWPCMTAPVLPYGACGGRCLPTFSVV